MKKIENFQIFSDHHFRDLRTLIEKRENIIEKIG